MANPKNRLVEAYTCTSCSPLTKITDLGFSYSVRGEVADVYQWSTHSGGWYHVGGTYWASGALNQLSSGISGLPTITYSVDGEGRVSAVNASAGTNPVTSTTYNIAGQVTDVTLGYGDSDHYTYDPNTGRMTQYKFTIGATPQNVIGNLTWNANGSLGSLGITDPFNAANSQTCAYSHDDVSRISNVSCGSVWSQSFGFDPFGNISKSGSISFAAGYVPTGGGAPNNRIQTGIPNVSYDANGSLLTINDGTTHTYTWDAEGKQLGIDSFGATYDALGRMVELNNAGTYTETVYGLVSEKLALMSGQTLQKAYVATPSGTAVYTASGLSYYRHADWLGSSRFASTTSRAMYSSSAYAAFGEQYAAAGTSDSNFTGQQPDTTSGLYDFLFRRLSQIQGRWISPDPAGIAAVDPANPQSWNRYAYVANNPLAYVDPLGLATGPPSPPHGIVDPPPFWWSEHRCDLFSYDGWMSNAVCLWTEYEVRNPAWAGPIGPHGGQAQNAANNGPKQTFSQCMAANSSTFSLAGVAQGALNGVLKQFGTSVNFKDTFLAQFLGGNTFSILYGSAGDAASVATTNTPNLLRTAMGTVTTYGRNTSTITSLNIARSGGLPQALSSSSSGLRSVLGAADKVLSMGMSFTTRLEIDAALAGAEAAYCAYVTK